MLSLVAQTQRSTGSINRMLHKLQVQPMSDGPQVNVWRKPAEMAYLPKCVCDHCGRFTLIWGNSNNFTSVIGLAWVSQIARAAFDVHSLRHLWQGWIGGPDATHWLFQQSRGRLEKHTGVQLLHVSQKDLANTHTRHTHKKYISNRGAMLERAPSMQDST